MAQQLQATVAVRLVLRFAHETERSGRRSGSAHRVAERIVEVAVGHRLRAVGYPARAAERIAVVKLARGAPTLAQTRRVDRVAVLQKRACRTAAIRNIVLGSRAIDLFCAQVLPVVGKRVRRSARICDPDHPVFHIVSKRRDVCAQSDARAVALLREEYVFLYASFDFSRTDTS